MEVVVERAKKRRIPNNGLIWHYTSMSVLENFLQGKIALTHFRFLNDSKDLEYGLDLLRSLAQRSNNQHLRAAVIENEYADVLTKGDSYLFCLSQASDSLYQWRSYAPRGGVAIGFRCADLYNALFDAVDDPKNQFTHAELSFLKCRYDDKSVARLINKLSKRIDAENAKRPSDLMSLFKCECTACSLFAGALMKVMLTQKNPSFSEEKEERFLLSGQMRHHVEILGEKPRIVFQSPAMATSIGEIKLSPHGDTVRNKLLTEMLRDKYNLQFDITESKSTYNGF